MDLKIKLYLERSENELVLAQASFLLSTNDEAKDAVKVPRDKTFFHNVISQSYYSVFYCAKAYLLSKGIETKPPEEHKKTYDTFKKFVEEGVIDVELMNIYEDAVIKAEELLNIFKTEKGKRGHFTYHIDANANKPFSEESLENSKKFIAHIKKIIEVKSDKKGAKS